MKVWPIYYKDLLKIGNLESNVGIATLWTIADEVIKGINPNLYCVAGQLYTKNGINYLIRNLLANKKIKYLIICGQDRSGSGKIIKKFWQNGICDSIHKEIDKESIEALIKNVKLIDLSGVNESEKIIETIKNFGNNNKPYGENEIFPEPVEKDLNELECSWPTDSSIFKVASKTIAHTWLKALKTILKFGNIKNTDSMKIKEVLNLTAVVSDENPDNFHIPDWMEINKEKIENYLPQILNKEKIKGLHYTYGERLQSHFKINQIEVIIKKLKKDKNARETVGVIFDPTIDHEAEHRPCITLIQLLFNNGSLNMNAYVRSHDIFGGWPLNAFGLRKLHKHICDKTDLPMGILTTISASAHIYNFNWEKSLELANKNLKPKFENDPRGYFKISINKEKKEIIVKHYSPLDNFLKKYKENIKTENTALKLLKKIDMDLAISLTIHAADLGIEIHKAETALRLGIDYTQDKPLNFNKY
jgi:thymidylate synthase